MNKFYFTFGTSKFYPYYGGWVEVIANDSEEAAAKFRKKYPDRNIGFINCAFLYTEDEWKRTGIAQKGSNHGHGCHEVIE